MGLRRPGLRRVGVRRAMEEGGAGAGPAAAAASLLHFSPPDRGEQMGIGVVGESRTIGQRFYAGGPPVNVTGVRISSGYVAGSAITVKLWSDAGEVLASQSVVLSFQGVQDVLFGAPVDISDGAIYMVSSWRSDDDVGLLYTDLLRPALPFIGGAVVWTEVGRYAAGDAFPDTLHSNLHPVAPVLEYQ